MVDDRLSAHLSDAAVQQAIDDSDLEGLLQDVGDIVAGHARANATAQGLVLTGAGVASIHAEVHRGDSDKTAFSSRYVAPDEELTAYVSWDQEHFYMGLAEEGTERERARPFMRPALEQTQI